jgi:hypothetical protein
MSTMVMELEPQEQWEKPTYLARQISKWFYDTSTSTATRVAQCGSEFGEGLDRLCSSYGENMMDTVIYVVWASGA